MPLAIEPIVKPIVLPSDGYRSTGKLQTQAGWWCLQIECVATDSVKNVWRRKAYINTGVQARERPPKVDAALIKLCGDKLMAAMRSEVSDVQRAAQVVEKQVEIDRLAVEKAKIVAKAFTVTDGVIGVRAV